MISSSESSGLLGMTERFSMEVLWITGARPFPAKTQDRKAGPFELFFDPGPGAEGERWNPTPLLAFPWGSTSRRRTILPARQRLPARLTTVVVLPTPPFWLATVMATPMFQD